MKPERIAELKAELDAWPDDEWVEPTIWVEPLTVAELNDLLREVLNLRQICEEWKALERSTKAKS